MRGRCPRDEAEAALEDAARLRERGMGSLAVKRCTAVLASVPCFLARWIRKESSGFDSLLQYIFSQLKPHSYTCTGIARLSLEPNVDENAFTFGYNGNRTILL